MASVVVKTIWQSKEIHEAGDPPAGVESCAQLVPEAPGGVTSPTKGITKKKKAVSFHGWVSCTLLVIGLLPNTAYSKAWLLEGKEGQGRGTGRQWVEGSIRRRGRSDGRRTQAVGTEQEVKAGSGGTVAERSRGSGGFSGGRCSVEDISPSPPSGIPSPPSPGSPAGWSPGCPTGA